MECRLKELRLSRGMSQEKLALEIQTSQQTISRVEAGAAELAADIATRAAEYFEVTVDYVLGLTEEREKEATLDRTLRVYKQNECFFKDLAELSESQQEMVRQLIHELLAKQREQEQREQEQQKDEA